MTSNRRAYLLAALAVGLVAAAGCGGQPKAHVRGKVTLDGKPVTDGIIQFFPTGATGQTAAGTIKDGVYDVEASVGEMKVTISANQVVGKQKMYDTPDSPEIDVLRQLIPARYNTASELKATLKDGTNDNVNFELTSGKEKKK
jgi:hypothetical protein